MIPPAPPYLGPVAHSSGNGNKPIHRIVIHCTVSPCAVGARDIAAYFRKPVAGGSAHYVVDADETIQSAYDSVVAWHAPPNAHSLGVEMCCTLADQGKGHWTRDDHVAMMRRTASLVAQLCLAYDVPIARLSVADLRAGKHGICGHVDVSQAFKQSSHWDPGPHFPWTSFMSMVRAAATDLKKNDGRPAAVVPKKKPTKPKPATHKLRVGTWNVQRDRNPIQVAAEVNRLASGLDVLLLQETNGYGDLLAKVPGFRLVRYTAAPEQGETCILVRDTLKVRHERAEQVTKSGWFTVKGGRTAPKWVTFARVDGCGFLSVHTPPTVQTAAKRIAAPSRWKAYKQLMASLERLVPAMPKPLVVAGDWNVSADSDNGMEGWPRATFNRTHLSRVTPITGTHGSRVIDFFGAKGVTMTGAHTLSGYGSDHKPVVGVITY